jgi:acyl-coenzyme A synthetase/AMP-(fatty) acid ligase
VGGSVVAIRQADLERIEIVLGRHPAVVMASVMQRPTHGSSGLTTAFVVLRRQVAAGDLARFVAEHLGQDSTIDEFEPVAHLPGRASAGDTAEQRQVS